MSFAVPRRGVADLCLSLMISFATVAPPALAREPGCAAALAENAPQSFWTRLWKRGVARPPAKGVRLRLEALENRENPDGGPATPEFTSVVATSSTSVQLDWDDPYGDATGFVLERATGSGSYDYLDTVYGATSYYDTGLYPATTYTYRMYSFNDYDSSYYSSSVSVYTPSSGSGGSGTQVNLVAPRDLSAYQTSRDTVLLEWSDVSYNEDGYAIERSVDGGAFVYYDYVTTGSSSYEDLGVTANTRYTYRIYSYYGNSSSNYSNQATLITEESRPATPTGVTAAGISDTSVAVSWIDNSRIETGYRVFRHELGSTDTTLVATLGANTTSFTDKNLRPSHTYVYNIEGFNSQSTGDRSADAIAVTDRKSIPQFGNLLDVKHVIVVGDDSGGSTALQAFDADTNRLVFSTEAFKGFTGGVRVATGDVNGDGVIDIVAGAGPGGGPAVKIFDGATGLESASFFPYEPTFDGGVYVAVADMNGDGHLDVVVGAGERGGPRVRIYDGITLTSFYDKLVYEVEFRGGVRVAAADVNGDGRADLITAPATGGGPRLRVLDVVTDQVYSDQFVLEPQYRGGLWLASRDLNNDGKAEIVIGADAGGGPRLRVLDGATQQFTSDFFAYPDTFRGGVRVGFTIVRGKPSVVTAPGPGGGTTIQTFPLGTTTPATQFDVDADLFLSGVFVEGN